MSLLNEANAAVRVLRKMTAEASGIQDNEERAHYYHDHVMTAMDALRSPIDSLEMLVDKEVWPMPSYGDLCLKYKKQIRPSAAVCPCRGTKKIPQAGKPELRNFFYHYSSVMATQRICAPFAFSRAVGSPTNSTNLSFTSLILCMYSIIIISYFRQ